MAIILEHCQIHPSSSEAHELSLPLTHFDIPFLLSDPTQRLLFFEIANCSRSYFIETIVPSIKNSLSRTLNDFLPLAGNIILPSTSSSGRTPVTLYTPGDSVSFTIGECDRNTDFNHLSGNNHRVSDEFYPFVPRLPPASMRLNEESDSVYCPVLALQITLFPEQGICLGLTNSHAICDGSGIVNFIQSWALVNKSMANMNAQMPFYERSTVQNREGLDPVAWGLVKDSRPFPIENVSPSRVFDLNRVRATFIMTRSQVQALKKYFLAERPEVSQVSSFTVVCAYVWTCSEKSSGGGNDDDVHFSFAADCRERLSPPLPSTYFGNCVVFLRSKLGVDELEGDKCFVVAAERIGSAIRDSMESEKGILDSTDWPLDFGTFRGKRIMSVAGSPRFDVYNVDFGWGKAKKYEFIHIDRERSMSLTKSREFEGGFEIGLSRTKIEMDAFEGEFNRGLDVVKDSSSCVYVYV